MDIQPLVDFINVINKAFEMQTPACGAAAGHIYMYVCMKCRSTQNKENFAETKIKRGKKKVTQLSNSGKTIPNK